MSEDLHSSRRKYDLEHSEAVVCWSQSWVGGRIRRAHSTACTVTVSHSRAMLLSEPTTC